jgi:hypothetical protein
MATRVLWLQTISSKAFEIHRTDPPAYGIPLFKGDLEDLIGLPPFLRGA